MATTASHIRALLRERNGTLPAAALLALALAATTVGCASGNSPSGSPEESPTATASPTADPEESAAKKAALAAYKGMRDAQTKAYRAGTAVDTKLRTYAYDKALGSINAELFDMQQAGVVYKGEPESSLKATAVSIDTDPQKVTVEECHDVSEWKPVLKSTGESVAKEGQPTRYTVTGAVERVGKKWMVVNFTVDREHTC